MNDTASAAPSLASSASLAQVLPSHPVLIATVVGEDYDDTFAISIRTATDLFFEVHRSSSELVTLTLRMLYLLAIAHGRHSASDGFSQKPKCCWRVHWTRYWITNPRLATVGAAHDETALCFATHIMGPQQGCASSVGGCACVHSVAHSKWHARAEGGTVGKSSRLCAARTHNPVG
jgi:hypothetical protein